MTDGLRVMSGSSTLTFPKAKLPRCRSRSAAVISGTLASRARMTASRSLVVMKTWYSDKDRNAILQVLDVKKFSQSQQLGSSFALVVCAT